MNQFIGYSILPLIVITWILIKRDKKMAEKTDRSTKILIVITALTAIPAILTVPDYVSTHSNWVQNDNMKNIIIPIILIAFFAVYLATTIIIVQFGQSIIRGFYRHFKGSYTSKIIAEESKLHVGGVITFETEFNTWLKNGFIKTIIRTRYEESVEILIRYDEDRNLGKISGVHRKSEHPSIRWKWHIPPNFSDGEYVILIKICDMESLLGFRITSDVSVMKHKISIAKTENQSL